MRKDKISKPMTMREVAEEWGLNYEVLMIKREIIDAIRAHCKKHNISQRKLAAMVPGMSQDRISDMYNGTGGGITIDKLVSVANALKFKVSLTLKAA